MSGPWEQYQQASGPWDEYAPKGQPASATKKEPEKESWLSTVHKGLATAPINAYLGAKQFLGGLDPEEQQILKYNREAEKNAPVSSFLSNVLATAPTAFIPGANTLAGAGLIGAATGLAQPVEGEQSLGNIVQGKALNAAIGGGAGAVGQAIGNKGAQILQNKIAERAATRAAAQSQNSVRDATLRAGQDAGYILPPSAVEPSWMRNRLESIGGKAAIGQEAAGRNQDVTNALARKTLGLPDDAPLSESTLRAFRDSTAQPYRDIAALPTLPAGKTSGIQGKYSTPYPLNAPNKQAPAEALRDLQLARSTSNDYWKEYSRTGVVTAKEAAQKADAKAAGLEQYLEQTAQAANRPDLVDALRKARTQIAKSFDVERALNLGAGDVSAPALGRALNNGRPLTGELETIAKFQQAFPSYMREGAKVPTPGVSKSEALAATLLGGLGATAAGPAGIAAAALPLLSGPARGLALSKVMQKVPEYSQPMLERAVSALPPDKAAIIARLLAGGAAPEVMSLAHQ